MLIRELREFGATLGHQGLVGRDDRDPATKRRFDVDARRLDAAGQFDEDVEVVARDEAAGFNARPATARAAPSWQGIIDAADQQGASLIALGSHGRTGLASVLIGSVAEAVAAHSKRAVLIVHASS